MSTKPEVAPIEEELEDAQPPPPAPAPVVPEPTYPQDHGWSGRSSKIRLAQPIVYGDAAIDFAGVLAPGEQCCHCLAAGKPGRHDHQLHLKFSRDPVTGKRVGPDAHQFEQLVESGVIAHTKEAAKRLAQNATVAALWGIEPTDRCRSCNAEIETDEFGRWKPLCPSGHRNGLPELEALDATRLRKMVREYRNGLKGALIEEQTVRRMDVEQLAKETGRQITDAITGMSKAVAQGVREGVSEAMKEMSKPPPEST